MKELSKEYLIEFYSIRLKRFGERPEALRWTSGGQEARYKWLTEILSPKQGSSVLDYGCGLGDLCGYLGKRGMDIIYTGTDINPELIERAAHRYPEGRFLVFDVEETPLGENETYDHIALCGVFNTKVEGATESMMNVLRLLYPNANRTLAATALSAKTIEKQPDINYIDPDELLDFAQKELSPEAQIIEHPKIEDFTLVLRN
jgi:SAM-dependent methyltransferase